LGSLSRSLQLWALIKKVPFILYLFNTSKAIGVVSGFGPSSTIYGFNFINIEFYILYIIYMYK
jgi:hypothetical protein